MVSMASVARYKERIDRVTARLESTPSAALVAVLSRYRS
jgi:hypothetical protein